MANTGRVQHAQRPVALRSTFLYVQGMARWATQRSIWLERKRRAGKAMGKGGARPLWWPIGRQGIQHVLRRLGRSSWLSSSRRIIRSKRWRGLRGVGRGAWGNGRGRPIRRIVLGRRCLYLRIGQLGETHRRGLDLLSQLQAEVPDPLVDDLPELLPPLRPRHPAVGGLFLIFIGKDRLERATMQVQIQHIGGRGAIGIIDAKTH